MLVTVAATMIAAVAGVLIEPELGQPVMVGYFSGVLVVDAAGWVLAYQRLISPLRAMAESCGEKTTLAQALEEVRADFLEELHDAVLEADKAVQSHGGPAGSGRVMSEETLRAVTALVDAAGIAKDLIQGMPEARLELDSMVIALTAGIPAAIALSVPIAAAKLPASEAFPVFLGTAVIAAVLLMLADLFGNERPPEWTRRVLLLRGLPVGAVSEKLRGWAESSA